MTAAGYIALLGHLELSCSHVQGPVLVCASSSDRRSILDHAMKPFVTSIRGDPGGNGVGTLQCTVDIIALQVWQRYGLNNALYLQEVSKRADQ